MDAGEPRHLDTSNRHGRRHDSGRVWGLSLAIKWLAVALVIKVVLTVAAALPDYVPPNFQSDFLQGRDAYFYGAYAVAFYAHVASGPACLVSGLLLLSQRLRARNPGLHRRLGRWHVLVVVVLLVPSGLWMSAYAMTGTAAASAFAVLSLATLACAGMGWQAAVNRRFDSHKQWMWRLFALLSSAVVIRVFGGLATVAGSDGYYSLAAWASWLLPLAVVELAIRLAAYTTWRPML
jgi:hypothetical protein